MKFAHYVSTDGRILGFFDPEIHPRIPEPNVEIENATWAAHVTGRARKVVDLKTLTFIDLVEKCPDAAEILATRQAAANRELRRRLSAAASPEEQIGFATAAALAAATPADPESAEILADVTGWQMWRRMMRTASYHVASNLDADICRNASWPEIPPDLLERLRAL